MVNWEWGIGRAREGWDGRGLTNTRWQFEQAFVPGFWHGTESSGGGCFLLAQERGVILMNGGGIEMWLMMMMMMMR